MAKGLILILMVKYWLEGLRQTGEGTVTYSDTGATYTGSLKDMAKGLILTLMVIILQVLGLRA